MPLRDQSLIVLSRYFACESFYNIAKVCKGEILMYFNEIFDALSKVSVARAQCIACPC